MILIDSNIPMYHREFGRLLQGLAALLEQRPDQAAWHDLCLVLAPRRS